MVINAAADRLYGKIRDQNNTQMHEPYALCIFIHTDILLHFLTVMTSAVYEMFTWTEFNVLRITFSNV